MSEEQLIPRGPWLVTVKRLSSGYFHVRGFGPENWAQPPRWPCDEETLRAHASSGACEAFIQEALKAAERPAPHVPNDVEVSER